MYISVTTALFLLHASTFFTIAQSVTKGDNVVKTNVGDIAGEHETVTLPDGTTSTLAVFRGIPYAEPPLGPLRFAKPVPKAEFTEIFNATQFGPACPQSNVQADHNMSEDCLYLNIYTPASALPDSGELLAVMFWIHGGGFSVGEGRNLPVQNLVAFGEVVIVTINYRLGPLGFLSVEGDREVSGNQGLYDQHLALKWVTANSRAFGGDAERITLVGGSAGGMSVTYQAMFPDNDGLFRRVIAESGTALSVSAYLTKSKATLQRCGCRGSSGVPTTTNPHSNVCDVWTWVRSSRRGR